MSDGADVLVVEDEVSVGRVLVALLKQAGHRAAHVTDGAAALEALSTNPCDVMLTDLRMPGMDGLELLDRCRNEVPDLPVIMITAHGSVRVAVDAMKRGASEFIQKPFDRDEVLFAVNKALAQSRGRAHSPPRRQRGESTRLLGETAEMKELISQLERVAGGDSTVLLLGETGTGKELAAAEVHARSRRADGPLIIVQCAALPEQLLESELFGYEKGAFTGAVQRKPGRVELAEGGTLFLDEIGEVAPSLQAKLLRLLQEKEYQPLGGTESKKADVRFVAATHRDLQSMVKSGEFREDLYYRLAVLQVVLPPLRERREDIALLARHLFDRAVASNSLGDKSLGDDAISALSRRDWPGNVRELGAYVERLAVLSPDPVVTAEDVEREGRSPFASSSPAVEEEPQTLDDHRRKAERAAILHALDKAGDNRTLAARLLGVSRRTLYNKLTELDLE